MRGPFLIPRGHGRAHVAGTLIRLLDRTIRKLCLWAAAAAAVFVAFIVIVGVADVIGTNFLARPVPSALEMSEAGMVVIIFGGLAYAQYRSAHVSVDLVTARLSGVARTLAAGLAILAAILVLGLITWRAGSSALESIGIVEKSSGFLRFPVYPFKVMMFLGGAIATLEAARQFVRLCIGRPDEVPRPDSPASQ
jgi:TRAP-type C4-dicarboxylate transport system permease small subunit